MQEAFSPRQLFLSKIRLWWIPLLLACVAAVFGWGISFFVPAQFEASAEINLAVDFSKIGILTDIEQDQIIEMVGDICKSPVVVAEVLKKYDNLTEEEFWHIASLERRNTQWVFKVRHADAVFAREVASAWREIAYQEILSAYEHAVIIETLSDYLNTLTVCFEQSIPQTTGNSACAFLSVADLQNEIHSVAEEIKIEQQNSFGISPAISISSFSDAALPSRYVSGSRTWLMIAGGGIGFLLGWWVMIFLPKKEK